MMAFVTFASWVITKAVLTLTSISETFPVRTRSHFDTKSSNVKALNERAQASLAMVEIAKARSSPHTVLFIF